MENKIVIYLVIFFVAFLLFFLGVILLFRQYRSKQQTVLKDKMQLAELHQQQLLQTQLEMQTQTMQEIGREIHDNVGQKLTLASLYTQQLDYDNQYPGIAERVHSISAILNASLQELRTLSKSLTNDAFATESLKDLLEDEIKKVKPLFSIVAELTEISIQHLSVKTILVRILQEFLQNTIKYAKADQLVLHLKKEPHGIRLSLKDNGVGFDTQKIGTKGIGLQNMQKRIALVGGTIALQSAINAGTSVEVFIPNEKL